MKRQAKIVTVFGSSRPREGDAHWVRARELELRHPSGFGERGEPLVHAAASPADAAGYLAEYFQAHRSPR